VIVRRGYTHSRSPLRPPPPLSFESHSLASYRVTFNLALPSARARARAAFFIAAERDESRMAGERKDRGSEGGGARKVSPSRISNSHQRGSFQIYSINSDDGKSDGTRVTALFRSALSALCDTCRFPARSSDDFRYSGA